MTAGLVRMLRQGLTELNRSDEVMFIVADGTSHNRTVVGG